MVPNTQNPNAQEVRELHDFDANSSIKGHSTPRTFTTYSSSWISSSPATTTTTIPSPSPFPSSSSAAAATTQKQQIQPLDVTPPVPLISNFLVTGTNASFMGYTTPTGATEGVLSVPSPSVSGPQTQPEPDSEPEAKSKSGVTTTTTTIITAQVTTGQDAVTSTTPQARDADSTPREEEVEIEEDDEEEEDEQEEAEEAAKKSRIKRQTAAAHSVCAGWLGADGRLKGSEYKKEEKRIGSKQIWMPFREGVRLDSRL